MLLIYSIIFSVYCFNSLKVLSERDILHLFGFGNFNLTLRISKASLKIKQNLAVSWGDCKYPGTHFSTNFKAVLMLSLSVYAANLTFILLF